MRQLLSAILLLLFWVFGINLHNPMPIDPEPPMDPTAAAPTEPAHSALYVPGLAQEEAVLYFNEVCLAAEFSDSGDPSLLQRWEAPILYTVLGSPTPEDLALLSDYCQWLNTIEGFPGIREVKDNETANMEIHFVPQEELVEIMGENFDFCDGGVTYWYDDNVIYDATICIRSDMDQHLRNSVILEEIYNGLGPVQDTSLRPDSIIYAEFSEPQALTDIDELILRLLYHPKLQCGMNADACRDAILSIYY